MTPEKKRLLDDVLDTDHAAERDAILLAGGHLLRRKRVRRATIRIAGIMAVLGLSAIPLLKQSTPQPTPVITSLPSTAPSQAKALTDEELLALFPDTPVALAGLENGQKRLIFPRPGDEEKFVTKL